MGEAASRKRQQPKPKSQRKKLRDASSSLAPLLPEFQRVNPEPVLAAPLTQQLGRPQKKRNPRPAQRFSAAEQQAFEKALELHGRNWKRVADYLADEGFERRDIPGVRSKAQRHFIHLFLANKALPAKVLESGAGYTLSGAPL